MTPRAALQADRYSVDQLLLRVSETVDPAVFDLAAYDEFIETVTQGRPYQVTAVQTALRFFCGGQYADTADLARSSYDSSPDLQRLYPSASALVDRLIFPDKLACSLDLATGTGKSYVMYAVARVMLNEGLADRVLVLCPSVTIETELTAKFNTLTADRDLTDLLPIRSGHPIPTIVDGRGTIDPGQICVENRHAAYENAGSSLLDSFKGKGGSTLVISDEAHHLRSAGGATTKKWTEFLQDPAYGFRWHLGVSGTCYSGNDYFSDVVFRYSVREAINERVVKEVFYLAEDDSRTNDERFQKLHAQHEKNRRTYRPNKPITIAVARDIAAAEQLASDLTAFLARQKGISSAAAKARVLLVTSSPKHRANLARLRTADLASDPAEWIVSVSMLTEGWDVHNVFQIYPHERRAFNSRLLISQVLGRGLRIPLEPGPTPVVYVFNHQSWGPEIDEFVAEILDQDTVITQVPAARTSAPHFEIHSIVYSQKPKTVKETKLETNKKLDRLKLVPQGDAEEETKFVSATDATRAAVLTTRVIEKRYPLDDVVEAVRQRLLHHDAATKGTLAQEYGRTRVEKMIKAALRGVGAKPTEVSQENRQRILNSFGGLRQRTAVSGARLETTPSGLSTTSTANMRPISERIAGLARDVGVFYDDESRSLSTEADAAALAKADEMPDPKNLVEVPNSFDFKSPTNVVLADHMPERRFISQLVKPKNAKELRSWVKAPDTGFYEIEYSFQEGGSGRSKRGKFNPDFFLWLANDDVVVVVEVKGDGDDSWRNKGKREAAVEHFATINEMLAKKKSKRRYVFRMLSPRDYDKFFESVRTLEVDTFRSNLEGLLDSKT